MKSTTFSLKIPDDAICPICNDPLDRDSIAFIDGVAVCSDAHVASTVRQTRAVIACVRRNRKCEQVTAVCGLYFLLKASVAW